MEGIFHGGLNAFGEEEDGQDRENDEDRQEPINTNEEAEAPKEASKKMSSLERAEKQLGEKLAAWYRACRDTPLMSKPLKFRGRDFPGSSISFVRDEVLTEVILETFGPQARIPVNVRHALLQSQFDRTYLKKQVLAAQAQVDSLKRKFTKPQHKARIQAAPSPENHSPTPPVSSGTPEILTLDLGDFFSASAPNSPAAATRPTTDNDESDSDADEPSYDPALARWDLFVDNLPDEEDYTDPIDSRARPPPRTPQPALEYVPAREPSPEQESNAGDLTPLELQRAGPSVQHSSTRPVLDDDHDWDVPSLRSVLREPGPSKASTSRRAHQRQVDLVVAKNPGLQNIAAMMNSAKRKNAPTTLRPTPDVLQSLPKRRRVTAPIEAEPASPELPPLFAPQANDPYGMIDVPSKHKD